MDELDRLYRRLVQNIRSAFPDLLTRPFEVSQLYQQIVPYRTNRRELALDTNEDYELALLQLLSGARGFLTGEAEMQLALRAELDSPNPDLRAFRVFATSSVALAPDALRALEQQPPMRAASPERGEGSTPAGVVSRSPAEQATMAARMTEGIDPPPAPRPANPAPARPAPDAVQSRGAGRAKTSSSDSPMASRSPAPRVSAGEPCRYCGGVLPDGRKIVFCPHCGHNVTVQHCPACATELEIGWKFCIACGRDVT